MNKQINLDELKASLCKQQALITLIESSAKRVVAISCSTHFKIFRTETERSEAIAFQNAVTQRLVNYLVRLKGGVA